MSNVFARLLREQWGYIGNVWVGLATGLALAGGGLIYQQLTSGDSVAPTATLTAPAAGPISGTVAVSATASDNVAVAQVNFFYNGTNLIGSDASSPYSVNWDTTGVANAAYTLTAAAVDTSNNTGTSAGVNVTVSNGGGGGTGNIWVDTNGGTCTRSASLVAYSDAAACSSFDTAYQASSNGDLICVNAGSYPAQAVTYKAAITSTVTIDGDCSGSSRALATVLALSLGNGSGNMVRSLTVKDMAITGGASNKAVTYVYTGTALSGGATDVTLDNLNIAVGKATPGQAVEFIGGVLRVTIKNSSIGPICCGQDVNGGSPVGIRFGTADRPGFPVATDVVIDNNIIKGITRLCTEWLTGYGACPATTCPNTNSLCHEDGIQIYGEDNIRITNNQMYHLGINGIFLDSTDPNTNGTIANNMIGDIMRGATCFDIDGRGIFGTWNIINNTCSIAGTDGYDITWASVMDTNNAIWNWKGNIGAISAHFDFGAATCTGGAIGVFTFSYNTLSTNNVGQTGCGGNETVGDPTYVNTALDPADTMNLHLSGAVGPADDKIPTATCSSFFTTSSLTVTDIDGITRPVTDSTCDAGADER